MLAFPTPEHGFPFQSYNETFIETGIVGNGFSLADMGDSLIWIGQDSRGVRACWRDPAFSPQRISTFAQEQAWQGYPSIDDAVAFAYIWRGHLIYQVTFPTARATWCYDATESALRGRPAWHERQFLDAYGNLQARPELFHCYAYGLHLVSSGGGDLNPGAIYQYSDALSANPPANPVLMLRWSDDGGNTWSNEYQLGTGALGQFSKLCYMNRLGYGRNRVFWLRYGDGSYTECAADVNGNQVQRPIVRDRITPHLYETENRIVYDRIQFETSRGLGPAYSGITGASLAYWEAGS